MAWTTPKTWVTSEPLGASDLNAYVRDNLSYLLAGRQFAIASDTGAASTASTTYIDVDAVNLTVTVTPKSDRIAVIGALVIGADNSGGNSVYARIHGDNSAGDSSELSVGQNNRNHVFGGHIFDSLTPDTAYTFTWQFKGVTGTVYAVDTTGLIGAWLIAVEI